MGRIYKSANGQEIDMDRLVAKNEKVRAVGNMNVNARGDVVDNANKVTSPRAAQVNKSYRKQTGNVAQDLPIVSSKKAAEKLAAELAIEEPIVGLDEEPAIEEVPPVKAKTKSVKAKAKPAAKKEEAEGGLAAAIAKAKEAK